MLMTEWNWDDALEFRYKEGAKRGMAQGREETARNALAKGASVEFIHEITGLEIETIKNLQLA